MKFVDETSGLAPGIVLQSPSLQDNMSNVHHDLLAELPFSLKATLPFNKNTSMTCRESTCMSSKGFVTSDNLPAGAAVCIIKNE